MISQSLVNLHYQLTFAKLEASQDLSEFGDQSPEYQKAARKLERAQYRYDVQYVQEFGDDCECNGVNGKDPCSVCAAQSRIKTYQDSIQTTKKEI